MIGGAVISDGRWQYLEQCFESLAMLSGVDEWVLVNDSGGPAPVPAEMPRVDHVQRRGMAAAVNSAWSYATACGWSHLVHVEEDFVIRDPLDVTELARILNRTPRLAQISLKRQAWAPHEVAAGGFVEAEPDRYHERVLGGHLLTVHQVCFTLNPCVIPRRIFENGWPAGNEAEQTERMLAAGYEMAIWGRKLAPPAVEHIGHQRSAAWML